MRGIKCVCREKSGLGIGLVRFSVAVSGKDRREGVGPPKKGLASYCEMSIILTFSGGSGGALLGGFVPNS